MCREAATPILQKGTTRLRYDVVLTCSKGFGIKLEDYFTVYFVHSN